MKLSTQKKKSFTNLLLLQDYACALLPMGCQTVEDLLSPQKKQLIELNITDPEHRYRLLAAAQYFYSEGWLSTHFSV